MRQICQSFAIFPAGAALFTSAAAFGQGVTYDLAAQVGQVCGVYNSQGQTIDVDFGALANTPADQFIWRAAGDVTYRCNIQAGFTRTVASQNNGFLTLGGNATSDGARRIEVTMQHWGADGFNYQQLATPRVSTHRDTAGNPRYLQGEDARVWFRAYGVRAPAIAGAPAGTRVFAGDYRDTVTITIMAN